MDENLMKEPIIFQALFEMGRIKRAIEKAKVRKAAIEKYPKFSQELKLELQEKSDQLITLLDRIISMEEPNIAQFETFCAACSVYNSEIYFLVSDAQKMKINKVYKDFATDTMDIFYALGERSKWDIFIHQHVGKVIIAIVACAGLEILLCILSFFITKWWVRLLLSFVMVVMIVVIIRGIVPFLCNKGLHRMAARVYDRHTYFNHKKQRELVELAKKLEYAEKLKNTFFGF